MEIVNKEMYHFHDTRISVYNDIWVPGNELTVDDNYQSFYSKVIQNSILGVRVEDDENYRQLSGVINYYLDNESKLDLDTAKELLKKARYIIKDYSVLTRENALEDVRKSINPDLPSRFHSMWLCDELSKQHWIDVFGKCDEKTYRLYKVAATGTLFKSSDTFIPMHFKNYNECIELAKGYWNPVFETKEQDEEAEYLFQGKIKVLEKIS